ncbi:DUF3500 domain-containing protein [Cellulophaga sp. F20128]|uniref:DUF3500 domain-containing protein n=1 Tax=Cellulophaga sp. F20128 TaxID=2926413 RepID=UPI001FF2A6D0|nr:DUF3500 domain-containing protein [Cellulophaga sp. F20128]MCK0157501.1 DUF3500 domain-containing protein [Cellulophaga sp. F20128]
MKKIVLFITLIILGFLYAFLPAENDKAIQFINSLDKEQRAQALFSIADTTKNTWHFIPGASFPRAGLKLSDLNTKQKELFSILLKDNLSATGYDKAIRIIALENVLVEMGGDPTYRNPEIYFIAFYGDPEKDSVWAWSFEGHHLSLNFSNVANKISIAPRFMGANPGTVEIGKHKGERVLKEEEDIALELIQSFTDTQKTKAIFQEKAFPEIVTSNASVVKPLQEVGIAISELNTAQKRLLQALIDEYLSSMPVHLAKERRDKIKKENYDEVKFGWAGSTTLNKPHYYRVQGKAFLIEFDNTQNNANHIHTVWRDFNGDFGRDLIQEHYKNSHKHND